MGSNVFSDKAKISSFLSSACIVLVLLSVADANANPAECRKWIEKTVQPRTQVLTRTITTYHWLDCSSVSGYARKGDFEKLAAKYVQNQLKSRSEEGIHGGGLYVATDPSASCAFGLPSYRLNAERKQSTGHECLVVVDVPAGTPLISNKTAKDIGAHISEDYERLDALGCFDIDAISRTFRSLREDIEYECSIAPKKAAYCKNQQTILAEAELQMRSSMEIFKDDETGDSGDTNVFERVTKSQQRGLSASYEYGTQPISPGAAPLTVVDGRALVLRGDVAQKIKIRIYEAFELTRMKSDEARNIVKHLSQADAECFANLKISKRKLEKNPPDNHSTWLAEVVSQKPFSSVVKYAVAPDSPVKRPTPRH